MSANNLTALYPTSYLEAVNELLAAIGEAPVNSIGTGLSESRLAQLTLDRVSRRVQKRGWWFNTETMKFTPNAQGEIVLPRNTLSIETQSGRYTYRNYKLYDKGNNTFYFHTPVYITLILALDWDSLPETARNFITLKASQRFQTETVGSAQANAELREEVQQAYLELNEEEMEAGNYNHFENAELMQDAYLYRRQ
ncbi:hypothetical protein ACE34P_003178 [Vibrio fluvialis]